MRKMTKEFLETAFAGESMAHMRYLVFAEKAAEEGKPNLARLFAAIAYAEQVHATNHYRELGMIKESPDNLQTCINGEAHELPPEITVTELLDRFDIDGRHTAVERNRQLVPRGAFSETRLEEGDLLEIVTLVGGG